MKKIIKIINIFNLSVIVSEIFNIMLNCGSQALLEIQYWEYKEMLYLPSITTILVKL